MTNREWLFNKMQNMSDEEFEEIVIIDCTYWEPLYKKCGSKSCSNCQREWLKSERKETITLSEAERIILEDED